MLTEETGISHPTVPSDRIDSIDVLRGVAVLGILIINVWLFGLPFVAASNPTVAGVFEGPDVWAFLISWIGFEGSQRAVFSMLFGASVILLTSRLADGRTDSPATIYYRRTIWLIVFGLIDTYLLLWYGDILFLYGMVGLLLYPARNVAPGKLFTAGLVILMILALLNYGGGYLLREAQPVAEEAKEVLSRGGSLTQEQTLALELTRLMPGYVPPAAEISAEIADRSGGYLSAFLPNAVAAFQMQVIYSLISLYWDALALMLIGMALFKWNVFDASLPLRIYILMTVFGFGIGLSVNTWETLDALQNNFASTFLYWTYDLGRLATSLGYVGLIMLICKCGCIPRVRRVFAATGRMALSNYVMQTIICNVIFIGFGLFGQLRFHELYYVVAGVWIFELTASSIWLKHFRFGPLEWVWRRLTYGTSPTKV